MLRRRKVDKSRFIEKPDAAQHFDDDVPRARPQARGGVRGLSLDIINREEQETLNLAASAAVLILPDDDDQALLSDWYFEGLSIAELARRHGNRQPRATANRLARLIGTADEAGAVTPVMYAMQKLNLLTAHEFIGQIRRLYATENMSDPLAAAIGHLELAATHSDAHRRQATLGILRLQWLQRHRPSNRGLGNKILLRLITAACTYVVEVDDARHDVTSEVGLHDDVNVLSAVQKAVERFTKA